MKIAVYTIALNEEQFARRWAESAAEADYRIVADTGSNDGTIGHLRSMDVTVHEIAVRPWRFDVARNANLALVPKDADICIALDMDELLMPGWRQALLAAWGEGVTRLRCPLEINIGADGKAQRHFYSSRIHQRFGYLWKYPIHEVITATPGTTEKIATSDDLRIRHLPDDDKPRSQYLPMLASAAAEDPSDDRLAHYHGRELMFHRRWDEAIAELKRHLALPRATWKAERSASMRFIARCYAALGNKPEARSYLMLACGETPSAREPWYELAKFSMDEKDWLGGVWAAQRAIGITSPAGDHTRDAVAWGIGPYDVGSVCAYYAGLGALASDWLKAALAFEPANPRLLKNGEWIFAAERSA
jgi:glycosyltransferase involved in cell wall biosynthesis